MDEICQTCGLPKSLCVCGQIEKEQQKIKIRMITRKFGKQVTHVSGFDTEELAKELDVAFSTVNRWFNGRTVPSKIQQYQIEKYLKKRARKS